MFRTRIRVNRPDPDGPAEPEPHGHGPVEGDGMGRVRPRGGDGANPVTCGRVRTVRRVLEEQTTRSAVALAANVTPDMRAGTTRVRATTRLTFVQPTAGWSPA